VKQEYTSRNPYRSAAVYGYRSLSKEQRVKMKSQFEVMLDIEGTRKKEVEKCI